MQITKSVNSEEKAGKASDTMGSKNRVEFGLYKLCGSINHQLAEIMCSIHLCADKLF